MILCPGQAEVAFWHENELRVVAQIRKPSRWDGVSTYVHVLSTGPEFVQSFHFTGMKNDKLLHADSRFDLPRERIREGRKERHIWDQSRKPDGAWHWTAVGLRWEEICQLPKPTFRPELVFESRKTVGVMLSFFPLTSETPNVPFPSSAMSTGFIHDVQPQLLAVAHFGDYTQWDDAMARRFDRPEFDDPPTAAHILMHPAENHWRGICYPTPGGNGLSLALNEPSPQDKSIHDALRALPERPRS